MIGLVVMKWDERIGADVIASYPAETTIPQESLMQIYSTHEYGGDAGMISLIGGNVSFASYYTGSETQVYIIALLELNDNPDAYEEGLGDMAQSILPYQDDRESLNTMLPNLFQRLSLYPKMNWEQHILMLLDDPVRKMVWKRLRQDGSLIKSELDIWLKDAFQEGFFDIETVLRPFYNLGLVEGKTLRNVDYLFLVQDILIARQPAVKILEDLNRSGLPKALHDNYLQECRVFFKDYKPSEEDQTNITLALLDPQVFEIFKLLRIACVTRPQLDKLRKKGVDDVDGTVRKMWQNGMICVLYDQNKNEYYALKSDVKITKIFGEYLVNVVKDHYVMKDRSQEILLNHLQLLEENYHKYQKEMVKVKATIAEEEE